MYCEICEIFHLQQFSYVLVQQVIMLRGGDKQFARQLSKKETVKALNLAKQVSETGMNTAVMSSRRRGGCSPGTPLTPPDDLEHES